MFLERNKSFVFLFAFLSGFVLLGCANFGSLGGGPQDKDAPVLKQATPASGTTRFNARKITLVFNEYVKLNDPQNMVITPFMSKKPIFTTDLNQITILFEDSLLPATTYVFNFTNLIGDNNENNRLKAYRYVFSTGDFVDSAAITGFVYQADDRKPLSDVSVGLYEEGLKDTALLGKKPIYVSKTDSLGKYSFENLSTKRFRVMAFTDKDNNFIPSIGEDVAILQKSILAESPAAKADPLYLVKLQPPFFKITEVRATDPGRLRLSSNLPFDSLMAKELLTGKQLQRIPIKDTLWLFHGEQTTDSLDVVFVSKPDGFTDTIRLATKKTSTTKAVTGRMSKYNEPSFFEPIKFQSTRPISAIDTQKLVLLKDSIAVKNPNWIIQQHEGILTFSTKIEQGANYIFTIPDSCIRDDQGSYIEKQTINFASSKDEDYGKLILNGLDSLPTYPLILQLLDDKATVRWEHYHIKGKSLEIPRLKPNTYYFRIIVDKNKNRLFDKGNLYKEELPEKVLMANDPIKLRANWDLELDVSSLK
jgi:hypothetical protein